MGSIRISGITWKAEISDRLARERGIPAARWLSWEEVSKCYVQQDSKEWIGSGIGGRGFFIWNWCFAAFVLALFPAFLLPKNVLEILETLVTGFLFLVRMGIFGGLGTTSGNGVKLDVVGVAILATTMVKPISVRTIAPSSANTA